MQKRLESTNECQAAGKLKRDTKAQGVGLSPLFSLGFMPKNSCICFTKFTRTVLSLTRLSSYGRPLTSHPLPQSLKN